MLLLQAALLISQAFSCLSAKSPNDNRFQKFHRLSQSSSPLKLDDGLYDELTSSPRNYSVAVFLTALQSQYGCELCREVQPEWNLVGRSWTKGDRTGASRVLFGTLDFANGRAVFQKLMLQSAPILLVFNPTIGPHAIADTQPLRLDFSGGQKSAEQIRVWIARHLPEGPRPPIVRPVNYVRIISVTTAILGLITLFSVASPYILPVIQNRNIWAAISLISILLFTSGHMFNHIRKVPYVSGDGKNGITYFAGGFASQFGLETQIVAAMYGTLSFATIALALKVPRMTDPTTQQLAIWAWAAIMLGMYSFLMSAFRIKNGSYPFWLPPF